MYLSLNKAAKEASISKSTLSEALNSGRITASKDTRGRWQIDPAALFQAFPKTAPNEHTEPTPNTQPNIENLLEIERLRAELKAERRVSETMSETIDDLRARLDQADTDRRNADARLEDLRDRLTPAPVGQGGKRRLFGLLPAKA